jgi:competence protein ComEA
MTSLASVRRSLQHAEDPFMDDRVYSTLVIALITSSLLSAAVPGMAGPPAPAAAKAPGKAQMEPARVNINTATVQELMTLSGVGRAIAERIVQHRQSQGRFQAPDDLRKVQGVGGGLLERNRDRIVVK